MSSNSAKVRWSAKYCIASERRHTVTTEHRRQKIARELPPAGTTFTGRFKGHSYSAIVIEGGTVAGARCGYVAVYVHAFFCPEERPAVLPALSPSFI